MGFNSGFKGLTRLADEMQSFFEWLKQVVLRVATVLSTVTYL